MLMRFSILIAALLAVCPAAGWCEDKAAPRPVSVQELSLLLRSGYTGDEVLKETAGRPLLSPMDAAAERALLDAGADARTVAALREGRRVASTTEADDLRQRQAATEKYKLDAWGADQARRAEAGRQDVQTKLVTRRDEQLRQVGTGLRDKLVIRTGGRLGPYDNVALAGKRLFLLYAAAGADKASRQWTAQLVDFYKKFAPTHPEFEIVLVSADHSAADMEKQMEQGQMPWPALAFDQLAKQPNIAALGQGGVPRLLLIDGTGASIAENVEDGKLVSPQVVLDVLSGKKAGAAPATAAR